MFALVAEDDGEDDAAEVSGGAGGAGYDSCKEGGLVLVREGGGGGGRGRDGVWGWREKRGGLTVGVWMHMRHQGIIRTVTGLEEKGHARYEPKHGTFDFRVRNANGDQERTGHDAQKVHPCFLSPHAGSSVYEIRDDAAERSKGQVEQPEHGGPSSRAGLFERGKVEEVVGS